METKVSVRKSAVIIVTGLFAFILYLYFFVGFEEILNVINQVKPVDYAIYYSTTFVAIMLSVLFYSITWHTLLIVLELDIGWRKAFQYCLLSNFVDLVIPLEAITGELTRVYLLHRESEDKVGKAVASVVSHRIISNFFALSALIISSISLIRYTTDPPVLYLLFIVIIGTAASIIILIYLSVKEEASSKLLNTLIRLAEKIWGTSIIKSDLRNNAVQNLSTFHQGVRILTNNPKNLIKPMIYTSISWSFHLIIYFLVFYALGFTRVSLFVPQMIIVFSISLAAQTLPIGIPVGLVEIVMVSLYTLFGIPPALGGTATTLIRIVTFWFQIIIGYLVAQWMGIKTLFSQGKN